MLVVNGVTLLINGVVVWLTIIKSFPAMLGIGIFLGCLATAIWFSCLINGKLPRKTRPSGFYTPSTEEVERI
jgi:hypothetical protein